MEPIKGWTVLNNIAGSWELVWFQEREDGPEPVIETSKQECEKEIADTLIHQYEEVRTGERELDECDSKDNWLVTQIEIKDGVITCMTDDGDWKPVLKISLEQ